MTTKLDIAIERIVEMVLCNDSNDDVARISEEIRWEIVGAIKEMPLGELAEHIRD